MTLDKTIVPGTQIRVKGLKSKTAGTIIPINITMSPNSITMWDTPGVSIIATAQIGEMLTVIKKPRKVFAINLCRVENSNGVQGEVYWTELRSRCEVV